MELNVQEFARVRRQAREQGWPDGGLLDCALRGQLGVRVADAGGEALTRLGLMERRGTPSEWRVPGVLAEMANILAVWEVQDEKLD